MLKFIQFSNCLIILTILFFNVDCALNEITNSEPFSVFSSCVSQIADKYFNLGHINIFIINGNNSNILNKLFRTGLHAVKIREFTKFKNDFQEVEKKYSILVTDTLEELLLNKKKIELLWLWNARTMILVVVRRFANHGLMVNIFKLLWDNFLINSVIMIPSENDSTVQELYTFYPYENGSCGQNENYSLIAICRSGELLVKRELFEKKVPKIFNGCPLRTKGVVWPPNVMPPVDGIIRENIPLNITKGVEPEMLNIISKILNLTLSIYSSIVPQNWGMITMDGNVTGNLKDIFDKTHNLAFGNYGPSEPRHLYCDYTVSFGYEYVTWCVPKSDHVPKWRSLLMTFQVQTWIAMLMSYIIICVTNYVVCNLVVQDRSIYTKLKSNFQYFLPVFFAMCIQCTPQKISGRIITISWIVFGFVFTSTYQAKLIGVLMQPLYEHQITTVEELLESNLKRVALPTLKRSFLNTDDWRVAKIVREWQDCDNASSCLTRVALKKDMAMFIANSYAKYNIMRHTNEDSEPEVFCLPQYSNYPREMFLTKGFPLRERINSILHKIQETGLINKWKADLLHNLMLQSAKTNPVKKKNKQLRIAHLQGIFYLWIFGLNLSLISLIFEQLFHRIKVWFIKRKCK